MSKLLRLAEAMQLCLSHLPTPGREQVALDAACGRVLASDIRSPMALPSFDHAAMDGYALSAATPLPAGSEHLVGGSQAAGDAPSRSTGEAWEIMTGARLPGGLDAVVAIERTELLQKRGDGTPCRLRLLDTVPAGQNVRRAGSDVAAGERLLAAGDGINPSRIMLLAALGLAHVDVLARPRVAIVCTGKELQADLARPLTGAQIYASNGPFLRAALASAGAQVLSCTCVDDTVHGYIAALRDAMAAGADLIVSTGAVSMGRYDRVPDALHQFGAELLFHKLAIRPGKPVLGACIDKGPLVMALPGTPMAVAVGMRFLVAPLLRAMQRQPDEPLVQAILDTPQQPKAGMRHFLRAQLCQGVDGRIHATVPPRQQPFRIKPFAHADAWVVLPEDSGDCPAGSMVEICSLFSGDHAYAAGGAGLPSPGNHWTTTS